MTEWRVVPGWDHYMVSEQGEVARTDTGLIRKPWIPKVAKNCPAVSPCIRLTQDGRTRVFRLLRLVAITFIGPPPFEGAEAAHLDGNALNCAVSNAAWKTKAENERDKIRHGTSNRGTRQHKCRFSEEDVRQIKKRLASGERWSKVADSLCVPRPTIRAIHEGRSWAWLAP